ncbi:S53 family peptidase [Acetobacteraceae bacterium KSS8]|uniref:S53 family peptidase n=1 Tax=Endosaccharibacter trunci TaxID=2812733 RepID=A0ABT1W4I5_9PROT|nr:S53 family peptidase [Acetobacteraceae bacterium KSS8]
MTAQSRTRRRLLSATTALAMACAAPIAAHAAAVSSGAIKADDVDIGNPIAQTVYLSLRNESGAEAYARAVQTPGPQFHKFLTREEFVKRFAPTDADIAKVESALTQLGYTIDSVFPNHLAIQVIAPAGTTEAALGVKLKRMTVNGRTGMVPTGVPTLPASIRDLVRGVGGLNTLHLAHPLKRSSAIAGQATTTKFVAGATLTGGKPGSYLPQDFATRYNVNPIYANGFTGRGATIGIITLANFYPSDAYTFWKAAGLTVDQNRITTVNVDGGTAIAPSDALGEGETDIDVEQSGGLAPGANLRVYVAPNQTNANFVDAAEAAASENIADTVSISWGQPELDYFAEPSQNVAASTYIMDAFHDVFLEMGIQGQSVYVATGDSGAYDTVRGCPNSGTPSASAPVCNAPYAVDSPANDPAVTGAGGTTLPVTLKLTSGAVLTVAQEQAWSWNYIYQQTAAQGHPIALAYLFSTGDGGGVSSYFKKPYYQVGVSGITTTKPGQSFTEDTGSGPQTLVTLPAKFAGRNLPDMSADADPETGYQFLEEGSIVTFEGGTSFVAPQLNGVTALAVQGTGGRVGLMNNIAYGLGDAATDDITAGDNWGYTGKTGYDNAAGLGVLNATKLANALLTLKSLYGR